MTREEIEQTNRILSSCRGITMNNIEDYKNKIINGDCLEIMRKLPDKCVDLILTDPPYDLKLHGGSGMGGFCERKLIKLKHIDFISSGFDYDAVFTEFIRLCKKVNLYIFCSNAQITKIMTWFESRGYIVTLLVWHKTNAVPLVNKKYHSNAEFIICVREQGATFNNLPVAESTKIFAKLFPQGKCRIHPTQKPLDLIETLIKRKSNEGDLILDAFSGSGATAIAADNQKRNFICIEKDQDFYTLSVERLQNHAAQCKLL